MAGHLNKEARETRALLERSIGPNDVKPVIALPPSDYIRDYMDALGWDQRTLAEVMSVSQKFLSQLLNNKAAITDDTARRLAHSFNNEPSFWMNLQFDYERDRKLGKPVYEEIEKRRFLYDRIPVLPQAIRLNMVCGSSSIQELINEVLSLLGLSSIDALEKPTLPTLRTAALRTHRQTQNRLALVLWANSARRKVRAHLAELPLYQPALVGKFRKRAHRLTLDPEQGPLEAIRTLRNSGITLLYHPPLKGTTIDGGAFWVDKSHPVIALTVRKKTLDEFWFVLLHEFGHIVKEGYFEDTDLVEGLEAVEDPKETAANNFAADTLIAPENWAMVRSLAENRKRIDRSPRKEELLEFSEKFVVHSHIIAGRLHFERLIKDFQFRKPPITASINKKEVIQALFNFN